MKIDKINSPVYVGRLGEKGVLSIGFDVSDWLALFPLGTFSVDFKPDYLAESFSLPPTQYRVSDGALTIDIEANITSKAGRASLGIRMLVGDSVDRRSAIIPVVIAESLPPATGEMPEPVQAWIDGAVIVIGQAQTATLNANEATRIANEQELLREGAESDRRGAETDRQTAEGLRDEAEGLREQGETNRGNAYSQAESARDGLYATAEDVRDGLYDDAEGARDDLYGLAETARDGLYSSAEISRNSSEGLRQTAETNRIALHNKWGNPEAIATTLAPDADATANVVIGAEKVTLNIGIPEGIRGDQGYSAYEVWEQSNAGKTEAEYIAFLKQEALAAAGLAETAAINANSAATNATSNMLWRRLTTNPASFYPVPQSPLYVRASGEPIQSGTGDPSPSNIRPITPWLASGGTVDIVQTDGDTITLTAPQEIPAGWMGNEGKGQVTWGKIRLLSSMIVGLYTYNGLLGVSSAVNTLPAVEVRAIGICTHCAKVGAFYGSSGHYIWVGIDSLKVIYWVGILTTLGLTTLAEFKAWLDTQDVYIYYQLSTPISITPALAPLPALPQIDRVTPRQNVLTASTGNVELTYAKSPIREADELAAAIAALS